MIRGRCADGEVLHGRGAENRQKMEIRTDERGLAVNSRKHQTNLIVDVGILLQTAEDCSLFLAVLQQLWVVLEEQKN